MQPELRKYSLSSVIETETLHILHRIDPRLVVIATIWLLDETVRTDIFRILQYLFRLTDTAELDALTIFNDEGLPITCETAKNMVDDYRKRDDVFSADFLASILIVTAGQTLSEDVLHLFGSWGCRTVFLVARAGSPLLGGPYLYSSRGIFHA